MTQVGSNVRCFTIPGLNEVSKQPLLFFLFLEISFE